MCIEGKSSINLERFKLSALHSNELLMPDMICNGKCSHFQNIGYFGLLLLGKLATPKRAVLKKKAGSKLDT